MKIAKVTFIWLLSAAQAFAADLEVRLTTDYEPLRDFDLVVTRLHEGDEGFLLGTAEHFVVPSDGFASQPVAELSTGYTGPVSIIVELFDNNGSRDTADDVLIARKRLDTTLVGGANLALFGITRPYRNVTKADTLFDDADNNGEPSPGDTMIYVITVPGPVLGQFSDFPGPGIELLTPGGVLNTHGVVTIGNSPGDSHVLIEDLDIPAGAEAVITLFTGVAPLLGNQGRFVSDASRAIRFYTDDPATPLAPDPTIVAISGSEITTCLSEVEDIEGAIDDLVGDPDGDGIAAAADHCPGTGPGAEVDHEGCSGVQFCGAIDINVPRGRADCNNADWGNDEPLGDPLDCVGGFDACEAVG